MRNYRNSPYARGFMKFNKKLTILIWVLSFTWALPTTLAGCIVALYLRLRGNKPKRCGPIFYFPITEGYGLNLGPFILVPKNTDFYLNAHELGHHLQACFRYGPFTVFVVAIPSVIRFWLREQKTYDGKLLYACLLVIAIYIVSAVLSWIGYFTKIVALAFIGLFLTIYGIIIQIWLNRFEVPRYKDGNYPSYDDAWFEGDATRKGSELMRKYFNEEVKRFW